MFKVGYSHTSELRKKPATKINRCIIPKKMLDSFISVPSYNPLTLLNKLNILTIITKALKANIQHIGMSDVSYKKLPLPKTGCQTRHSLKI